MIHIRYPDYNLLTQKTLIIKLRTLW